MKKSIILFSTFLLFMVGCSKQDAKLAGKWTSPSVKGFVAEFNNDHTGTTSVTVPGHTGAMATNMNKLPFKWEMSADGKIKITEDKATYYGRFSGNTLELEVNGAKTTLERSK